jgi:uncharacterized protein YecE (DUF72 family)
VTILVGTSGWSYPTGRGTWNGVFYPARRPRGFDELAYYAEHFDTVEVNSTFYRMPEAPQTARWVERTPGTFIFSVKLFQKFTHPDMYLAREGVSDWDLSRADVDLFRAGIGPLAEAGRIGAVLIQFPPSFHRMDETRAYLDWLLGALAGYPLAVELRHKTWSDDTADTAACLAAHEASWVLIDEPKFKSSVRQENRPRVSVSDKTVLPDRDTKGNRHPRSVFYTRLHGRNAAAWWDHPAAEDRYNYLYSAAELQPFADTAQAAAASGRRVLVYLNNHFSAKAVANAAVLKHQLHQPLPGEYPREMVERYPDLAGLVEVSGLEF